MEWVSYRDDLDAAHARIAALENELAASRRKPEPATELSTDVMPERALVTQPPKPRRFYYHAPPTYVPLLRRFITAIPVAFNRRPGVRRSHSNNVLAYFAH